MLPQNYLRVTSAVIAELHLIYLAVTSETCPSYLSYPLTISNYSIITPDFTIELPQNYPQNDISYQRITLILRVTSNLLQLPRVTTGLPQETQCKPQNYYKVTQELHQIYPNYLTLSPELPNLHQHEPIYLEIHSEWPQCYFRTPRFTSKWQ